ncbi:hypothetical protein OXPF_18960 [Oxobacter pfennigii]|uniref:Uncharacterized protein n=1 Tax=Oxobacter pfennigii TaxID=36849 RepID=A0A0P8YYF7_9CLOT|nr:hypothetical protein [Oxobacter pfennigii]KPU44810.1 hypothetical protein OXPF_18960 [Oxobacter pfennigii]
MSIIFFYISILIIWILFFAITRNKHLDKNILIIGIASAVYSLIFEMTIGGHYGLYHYINPENSMIYLILASILIYPLLNMFYIIYLPGDKNALLKYTIVWIIAMLIFELASLYTKTIVLTGWQVMPWSILTYVFTYFWINILYKYLIKRPSSMRA